MWGLRNDFEVVGLADPDEEGRRLRGEEAGAKRTYADYREMLEKERPDFVSIGPRWTVNHQKYFLACVEAGSHGIIEKPLCVDLGEADAMIAAAAAKSLKWAIAFNFRASPLMEYTRRLVMEEELIGEVLELRMRGKEDRRAGGEDLIVLGVHLFDMAAYFLGPPLWCASSSTVDGRPVRPGDVHEATEPLGPVVGDRIHSTFGFADGVNGYFASMKNPDGNRGRWGMDIYGSKGVIAIRMDAIPHVRWFPEPSWLPDRDGDVVWQPLPGVPALKPGPSKVWHYAPIIDDLVEAVESRRQPEVGIEHGRLAQEMIQATFESTVQGGVPVEIPLKKRDHPLRRWT
jgi:predicted dehydrogenase